MVYGVVLCDGKVCWYCNCWVCIFVVCVVLGEFILVWFYLCIGIIEGGFNINVLIYVGCILVLVEVGVVNYEFIDELDIVGFCDFDGILYGGYIVYLQCDLYMGELYVVFYLFVCGYRVQYLVIGIDGYVCWMVDIEVVGLLMMYSFFLIDNYVVIYDLLVIFDLMQVVLVFVLCWL